MSSDERTPESAESRGATSTSRSLLARLRDDESEAWDRLVTLYTPLVVYWCRKLQLPEQDVADVVQEVFKAVAVHLGGFRKERPGDTFRGWLRTITRSKVMDHWRRQRRQIHAAGGTVAQRRLAQVPEEGLDSEAEQEERLAADESDDEQVHSALFHRALKLIRADFHERTWQAFWRVVVDGRTAAEVADELSMRPGTVRVAKSRVLQRLRRELGELLD